MRGRGSLWMRWRLAILLALLAGLPGCGSMALIVEDAVVVDHRPVRLVAQVGRKKLFGLNHVREPVPVTFRVGDQEVGRGFTDEKGEVQILVSDLPDHPAPLQARTWVSGEVLTDTGRIFYWGEDRTIIAVDIDYTIVETSYLRLLFGDHIPVSRPMKGARQALQALSGEYHIVYTTARPRYMLDRTRRWLEHYDFPPGPVVVAPSFRDVFRQTRFKSDLFVQLREQWPELLISVGNRSVDVESAAPNLILPLIIHSVENDTNGDSRAIHLQNWSKAEEFFKVNRDILSDPRRLDAAIREGLTFLQPVREGEIFHYQRRHIALP